jgi:Domain of unknown function (DUF4331)
MKPVLHKALAAVGVSALCLTTLAPTQSNASSHREAPLIAGTPSMDNTDLYAFVSPDDQTKVTILANWTPFEEPNGGPNFYPFAENTAHDINIDNNGDAKPDIIYRWTFKSTYKSANTFLYNTGEVTSLLDKDLNFRQTYTLQRITPTGRTTLIDKGLVAPSFTGAASMPDYGRLYRAAVTSFGTNDNGKSFAGQADDPFFADLRVFDLLYGGDLSEAGQDTLGGYNVNTIGLQVDNHDLAYHGNSHKNPVVGIWTTTSRIGYKMASGAEGGLQQVSRLGNPLVNEAVIPVGMKNKFNATAPTGDGAFASYVTNPELPTLMESIYGIPAPATPRADLAEVFLTGLCATCGGPVAANLNSQKINQDVVASKFVPSEQLRLNMLVPPTQNPNRLGVIAGDNAGFPNGRRLADDVIDVTVRVAEGKLLPTHDTHADTLGDGVDGNHFPFRSTFPYVALPNQVSVNHTSN